MLTPTRRLEERRPKRGSERACIATGETASPATLVRFALSPEGVVTPDLAARLPGRGAWTRPARAAITTAASKGLFARAFRKPARLPGAMTPEGLADAVERGLEARALAALGLARRAGKAVIGFEQAKAALKEAAAAVLVTAADAGADGADKLARLAPSSLPIVAAFTVRAQSDAFGRENVTHAAILPGAEATRFLRETDRLAGFRRVYIAVGARAAVI